MARDGVCLINNRR